MKKTLIQKLDQLRKEMSQDNVRDVESLFFRFGQLVDAMIEEIEDADREISGERNGS